MKKAINLIFPNQLFAESPLIRNGHEVYLIEEYLFFRQYPFHKQKIAFHRASMKYYQQYLEGKGITVQYIDSDSDISDISRFDKVINEKKIQKIQVIDPVDNWLEKRINSIARDCELKIYANPQFLNSKEDLASFFRTEKKSFFQTTFYKQQRKQRGILLDDDHQPKGGKWTFDSENRKKYPKGKTPPAVHFPGRDDLWDEAVEYTENQFGNNPGHISKKRWYPVTHMEAIEWFDQFLKYRFCDFGVYEDAIVKEHSILNHSVLSPLINAGLILPEEVVNKSLTFAKKEDIPLNSLEGFIRQIIGWREFIRGMYISKGSYSRTRNYWKFDRKIPECFYNGSTGIEPIDKTIRKILNTGYCHHIERLMVIGNFMLLCEFDPDEVYKWFMLMFIDAYDWVMVPNVYGMSQFADGGTFATKPYVAGSNYIKKMSNYTKGDWEKIWDGLFWRFINKHQDFFLSNPRTSMLVNTLKRMPEDKLRGHIRNAERFMQNKLNSV